MVSFVSIVMAVLRLQDDVMLTIKEPLQPNSTFLWVLDHVTNEGHYIIVGVMRLRSR